MINDKFGLKKLALIGLGILVVIGIILLLLRGFLSINITSQDSVVSFKLSSESKTYESSSNSWVGFIPAGDYRLDASNASGDRTISMIHVTRFWFNSKSIDLEQTKTSEALTNLPVVNYQKIDDNILYIDETSGYLMKIDQNSKLSTLDNSRQFNNINWMNSEYGVGITYDSDDVMKIVKITPTKISQIILPVSVNDNQNITMTNDKSGNQYIDIDGQILVSRDKSNTYQLLTLFNDKKRTIYAASKNSLLSGTAIEDETIRLNLTSIGGKTIEKTLDIPRIPSPDYQTNISFSPNGENFLVASAGNLYVYNKNLELVRQIAYESVRDAVWSDDDTVMYTLDNAIWQTKLSSGQSKVNYIAPDYTSVGNLEFDETNNRYLFTASSDGLRTLYKTIDKTVVDQNQQIKPVDLLAESNTQKISDACDVNYINLNRLELVIKSQSFAKTICSAQVDDYLDQITIKNKIPYQFFTKSN